MCRAVVMLSPCASPTPLTAGLPCRCQDYLDTSQLLSPANVDRDRLMAFAREAADFSTGHRLPPLQFAVNHYGLEDVAMFDFTCMYAACHASTVMERRGHRLLLQLVGDSLLEVGSGAHWLLGLWGVVTELWWCPRWAPGHTGCWVCGE